MRPSPTQTTRLSSGGIPAELRRDLGAGLSPRSQQSVTESYGIGHLKKELKQR